MYTHIKNSVVKSLKLVSFITFGAIIVGCQTVSAPNSGSAGFIQTSNPFAAELPVGAQWNELMLAAVSDRPAFPTITSHKMFMVSAAMFDAYAMYTNESKPFAMSNRLRRPAKEHTFSNRQAAVSQAAYQMLIYLFPNYEDITGNFRRYLSNLGLTAATRVSERPEGVGYAAALATIIQREGDDSYVEHNYNLPSSARLNLVPYTSTNDADPGSINGIFGSKFDLNHWQPLRVANGQSTDQFKHPKVDLLEPTTYQDQRFLTPHWRDVVPFSMVTSSQFRAEPPPFHGSSESYTDALGVESTNEEAYIRQLDQLIEIGQNLTDEQKASAEFWASGPRSSSPPGHWNQIAQGIVERDNLDLGATTQLFFALNAAMLDTGIAVWETKRKYDYIRPVSAIRKLYRGKRLTGWAGPNRGIRDIPGEQWMPYQKLTFISPPYPGYVSAHSAFSRAASEVLTLFTGSGAYYDGETKISHDINGDTVADYFGEHIVTPGQLSFDDGPQKSIVLRWDTFIQAADAAGRSGLYGGTHIQDSDFRGRTMGNEVGRQSFCKAQGYFGNQDYTDFCKAHNQSIFLPSE